MDRPLVISMETSGNTTGQAQRLRPSQARPYKTLFIPENAENIIIGKTVVVCEVFNLAIRKNIFLAYQLK